MRDESQDKKDYLNQKIKKSNQSYRAAILMLENGFYNEAINRFYYSCFHLATAYLFKYDITVKTHSGVINMLNLHLRQQGIISDELNVFYASLFSNRNIADYDELSDFNKDTAEDIMKDTEIFIDIFKKLLKN